MKRVKRLLALCLVLATLMGALPVAAMAANTASGKYGNLSWTLDSKGTLTISGKGAMPNKTEDNYDTVPWIPYIESIHSIVIKDGVTGVGAWAFNNCIHATSVTIPTSVTDIGEFAFVYCGFTSLTIPSSVKSISEVAFFYCCDLTEIKVDANNKYYSSQNGLLLNKTKTELIACPAGKKGTVTIPSGVTKINFFAFAWNEKMDGVTIPSSVTSIEACAFYGCTSLASVTIPSSVKNIEDQAFGYSLNVDTDMDVKIKGFTITGYTGTAAERYAKNNSFTFKTLTKTSTLATPKITAIENIAKGVSGIKMNWGKVSGATSYEVYRRKHGSGGWTKIATVTSPTYTDTSVRWMTGTLYDYSVVAVSSSARSSVAPTKTILRMAAPAITGLTNSAAKTIKATWSQNKSADGYQIWYQVGDNAASRKIVTVYGSGTLSRTINGLTKGNSYKVFVRSFKKVNGTYYYSAWSASRTVKVSK